MESQTSAQTWQPNANKNLEIDVDGVRCARLPIKTHVIVDTDNILDVVEKYAKPHVQPGDILFMSERVVAITQKRAYRIDDIKPSWWANTLSKFVTKTPRGIGIGSPWTMELAIREAGLSRMLFAAAVTAITRPFGVRGLFYKLVGKGVNAIDGPCDYTLPPYNKYAILGPADADGVAQRIKEKLNCDVVIIDANDYGAEVLGRSLSSLTDRFCKQAFRDNPLGQSSEQTPLCLVRKVA